jgi:hypothetical protein
VSIAHTKASIAELLATNDRAVARALVVLKARQTRDEQTTEQTRYLNNRGFRPCDARRGTSMATVVERFGLDSLTPKQVALWRRREKSGKMKIAIYAGQLLEEAAAKSAQQGVK